MADASMHNGAPERSATAVTASKDLPVLVGVNYAWGQGMSEKYAV